MISFIFGKVKSKGKGFIVLEANNIGYKVFVSPTYYSELNISDELEIYTHQYIREDALDLYGFRNDKELEIFEMLLSISGIGPKSALGVLAVGSVDDIKNSISTGDSGLLTKVSGIGRKTAERVVLELRDKISFLNSSNYSSQEKIGNSSSDEIDALVSLGYSVQQAREALKNIDPSIKDSSERIREALRGMK